MENQFAIGTRVNVENHDELSHGTIVKTHKQTCVVRDDEDNEHNAISYNDLTIRKRGRVSQFASMSDDEKQAAAQSVYDELYKSDVPPARSKQKQLRAKMRQLGYRGGRNASFE